MPKMIEKNSTSPDFTSSEEKVFTAKLQMLLWSYMNEMRSHEPEEIRDFSFFLLYCSYVSRNVDNLGLDDFDPKYSIDEVRDRLGNEYLASEFVDYYAGLNSQKPNFPDLYEIDFSIRDLSRAIASWADALIASGLSLREGECGATAPAIQQVIAQILLTDRWGKYGSEFSSSLLIADLATRLADVDGKTVLDFACGNGIYLASAISRGAVSVCGRDINVQAVMRAKIGCFFADPKTEHDIAIADVLTSASETAPAQRIFVAPPLGMRLREFDIKEMGYYADVMSALIDGGATIAPDMEDFCVAKALASLTDDGIAVLHVSAGFLFRQNRARQMLRRALVEGGYLRSVIELPGGIIPGTMVKSALMVIEKQPSEEGVLFVDLDSKGIADKGYIIKTRGRCEITGAGIDWLAKTVQQRDEIPLVSALVGRERIIASRSSLCYSSYGDVFDYSSILEKVRPTEDIMNDIHLVQTRIDTLNNQIADILNSTEQKGR